MRPGDEAREQRIANLFAECLDRLNAGEAVDLDAVIHCHPELAPDLREALEALSGVQGLLAGDTTGMPASCIDRGLGEQVGPYRLLHLLGEGGFGRVYLAEQVEPIRRRVAVKVIKPGMDTESVLARFEAERNALALMDHPYVAKVFDAGVTDSGRPYFVMEYADGVSITRFCDERCLKTGERLQLFCRICDAVQHAHQKGIIHRDIKPANVLVSGEPEDPMVKVIDFGVAKALHQRLTERTLFTEQGLLVGTPEYMSPEQAGSGGGDLDTRTDIYSLGVLLYELLVGVLPFEAADLRRAGLAGIQRTIQEVEPARPSDRLAVADAHSEDSAGKRQTSVHLLVRELRGDLDWIVLRAIEKERSRRYAAASELAADIRRYFRNEPVVAGPPSRTYRLRKFAHRHRGPLAAALSVVLALIGGLMGMTFLYLHVEEERLQKTEALLEKERALAVSEGLRLAAEGQLARDDPGLQLLLGLEAESHEPTEVCDALLESVFLHLHEEKAQPVSRSWLKFGGYSSDGSRFVTFSGDQRAQVWDATSLTILATLDGHTDEIHVARFDSAGERVVTASADQTARIWDATSGELLHILRGHQDKVVTASFSPDGQLVLTQSWDRTARVWNARTGRMWRILKSSGNASFSPDGSLVLATLDKEARLYDPETGELVTKFPPHSREIHEASFSRDGRFVITASWDSELRCWDVPAESGAQPRWERGMEQWSGFLSDEGLVVVQISDNSLEVLDVETGQRVSLLEGHRRFAYQADFSHDGRDIITGSTDGTARVWELATGRNLAVLEGHHGWGTTVKFGPADKLVLSVYGPEILVHRRTGEPVARVGRHDSQINFADFTPDGRRILSLSNDGTLRVWAVFSPYRWHFLENWRGYDRMVFGPSGRSVLAVLSAEAWYSRPEPRLGDLEKRSTTLESVPEGWNTFSPDGKKLVVDPRWEKCRVYDVATGDVLLTLPGGGMVPSKWLWLPDGSGVVEADQNQPYGHLENTLKLYDSGSGELLTVIRGYAGWRSDCAVSPDGRWIVAGTGKAEAAVWDLETGRKRLGLEGHDAYVTRVAYDATGDWMATGTTTGCVHVWSAVSGSRVCRFEPLGSEIVALQFSPSGSHLAAQTKDGRLEWWHEPILGNPVTLASEEDPASWFELSPDGRNALLGRGNGIEVVQIRSGTVVFSQPRAVGAKFVGDGGFVMFGLPNGEIRRLPLDLAGEARRVKPRELTLAETDRFRIGSERVRRAVRKHLEKHARDPGRLEQELRSESGVPESLLRAALQEASIRRDGR